MTVNKLLFQVSRCYHQSGSKFLDGNCRKLSLYESLDALRSRHDPTAVSVFSIAQYRENFGAMQEKRK